MKKLVFFALWAMCFQPLAWADNGLWIDGKDRPGERVNVNLKSLSPDAYVKVSEKLNDAIVNISTTKVIKGGSLPRWYMFPRGRQEDDGENRQSPKAPFDDFFGDEFFEKFFGGRPSVPKEDLRQQSLGSGFVLNKDGYIVTNNHVVERADEIKIRFADETEFKAKLVGRDSKTDVALLKVDTKKPFRSVILGDSDAVKVGDVVVAIGNPFGLSHSVTQGIISAKERSIGFGAYDDFIQTDASINPGNSGGPLLNLHGEVIGINAAIVAAGQGIGFAIPINLAKDILFKLKTSGRVVRGWLGVLIQKVTPQHAIALKLPKKGGALVSEVMKDSPAQKAGIKVGDVIVQFDDKEIKDWHELPIRVAKISVGQKVKIEVIRDGKLRDFAVEIARLEDKDGDVSESESADFDQLGLKVRVLDAERAKSLDVEKGVAVTGVSASSVAAANGIREGDIILEVNRKKVSDSSSYSSLVEKLQKGKSVLLLVKRGKGTIFIAFTL